MSLTSRSHHSSQSELLVSKIAAHKFEPNSELNLNVDFDDFDKKIDEVYNFIKGKGIWYEVTEHKAVYSMDDLKDVELPYREGNAKNLFLRDDKKKNYYLIMVREEKRVNLSLFRKKFNTGPLTFASSEDLERILGLYPGAVSPLGLLNDNERKVKFYLDDDFHDEDIIGMHPNDNTASLWLKVKDLKDIIKEHGNEVYEAEL